MATEDVEAVLLTIPEAASALRISRAAVYRLIDRGELNRVHIGSSARVPARAVREFAERIELEQCG